MPAPWHRQPGETDAAWQGFQVYRDLGVDRSALQAYRQRYGNPTAEHAAGYFQAWSARNDWVQRARAYDAYQDELARIEKEKVWRARAAEQAADTWQIAVKLEDKMRKMLELPLTTQEFVDNGRTVIIKPARWTMADTIRIAKQVDDMKRLATGHPTTRSEVNVNGSAGIAGIMATADISKLNPGELDTLRTLLEKVRHTTNDNDAE